MNIDTLNENKISMGWGGRLTKPTEVFSKFFDTSVYIKYLISPHTYYGCLTIDKKLFLVVKTRMIKNIKIVYFLLIFSIEKQDKFIIL